MKLEIELHVLFPGGGAKIIKTLDDLLIIGNKLMTKISESVAAQKVAFTRLESSIAGLGEDITALASKIAELRWASRRRTPDSQRTVSRPQHWRGSAQKARD